MIEKSVNGKQMCYWWNNMLLVDTFVIGGQIYYWWTKLLLVDKSVKFVIGRHIC